MCEKCSGKDGEKFETQFGFFHRFFTPFHRLGDSSFSAQYKVKMSFVFQKFFTEKEVKN
jgi:hypothetical protein